ncbi:MAG: cadherin-like beta sandwich domain-containing protein [Bacilli bacterium]|nr:cadherin-like beta sandwich domain-containing protein [Bacilli bacterium]
MKKIKYLTLIFVSTFLFNTGVKAASSLYTSSSTVYNGSTFKVGVKLSGVASWEIHVSASGPVSGCSINQADATENAMNGSKTYTAECKTTGTGTIKINLNGNTTDQNGNTVNISGSKSVNVISKPTSSNTSNNSSTSKKETKSSNNNLKSLEIEGYKLSPEFDKNKTDYTLTVPNDVNKIKILAYKEDDKASLSGDDGEKEVKEGENKFSVVVKAENGSEKKYNITITVDSKPIIVKIQNEEYTLIKKKDELPELELKHEDLTLNIEDQEVPAYRIDNISYVLVGLKDKEGNVNLYKFDSFKDNEKPTEYKLFKSFSFDSKMINIIDFPKNKIPSNYKKYSIKINDQDVIVYKLNKNSKYSLIYGINLITGKENIYRYDSDENTIQIYEREEEKILEEKISQYEKLILILGVVIVILILLVTIGFTRKVKNKETNEIDNELTKKEIKKIEKDTKKQNKKNKKKLEKGEPEM